MLATAVRSDRPQRLLNHRACESNPVRFDAAVGIFLSAFGVIVRLFDHVARSVRGLNRSVVAVIWLQQRIVRVC